MSKCIFCGKEVEFYDYDDRAIPNSVRCNGCGINWRLEEHKDNDDWAVRHIRALEAECESLTKDYQAEFNKLSELLGSVVSKLAELESRIKHLEDSRTN